MTRNAAEFLFKTLGCVHVLAAESDGHSEKINLSNILLLFRIRYISEKFLSSPLAVSETVVTTTVRCVSVRPCVRICPDHKFYNFRWISK